MMFTIEAQMSSGFMSALSVESLSGTFLRPMNLMGTFPRLEIWDVGLSGLFFSCMQLLTAYKSFFGWYPR